MVRILAFLVLLLVFSNNAVDQHVIYTPLFLPKLPAHLGGFFSFKKLTHPKQSCKQPPNYDIRKHTEFTQSSKSRSRKHSLYFSTLPAIFCWPTLPHTKGSCCAYLLISSFRPEVSLLGWFIQPGQTAVWKPGNGFPEPVKGCLDSSCQVASRCNSTCYRMKQANSARVHVFTALWLFSFMHQIPNVDIYVMLFVDT